MKVLETDRLLLRHLEPEDLDTLFEIYSDPEGVRFIPDAPMTLEEARRERLWHANGPPGHPELGLWATVLKASGELVGRCGLLPWTIDGQHEVEIADLLRRSYWGLGLATEAARALLDHGFSTLRLPRLICLLDFDNAASVHVARTLVRVHEKDGEDEIGPFSVFGFHAPSSDWAGV